MTAATCSSQPMTEPPVAPYLYQLDPIALQFHEFSVFGMTLHPAVHWYGVMYLLAFAASW